MNGHPATGQPLKTLLNLKGQPVRLTLFYQHLLIDKIQSLKAFTCSQLLQLQLLSGFSGFGLMNYQSFIV